MSSNPLNFNDLITLVRDGEPVVAGVPNRPVTQLDERTRYLWALLQAAAAGSTVFARQVTVSAACNVGQPVFYNSATAQFEQAIAAVNYDAKTGLLSTAQVHRCGAWCTPR